MTFPQFLFFRNFWDIGIFFEFSKSNSIIRKIGIFQRKSIKNYRVLLGNIKEEKFDMVTVEFFLIKRDRPSIIPPWKNFEKCPALFSNKQFSNIFWFLGLSVACLKLLKYWNTKSLYSLGIFEIIWII